MCRFHNQIVGLKSTFPLINKLVHLSPEPEYQNYSKPQHKASSRFPFACHLAVALGLLSAIFMSLLLFKWILPEDPQRSTCASCPDLWIKYRDHCYYISVEKTDWNSSREFCIAKNSSLLVLADEQEMVNNSMFKYFLNDNFHWIGLRNNSGWKWEDGSTANEVRIRSNSRIQQCGAISKDFIQASSCNAFLQWVCKKARL